MIAALPPSLRRAISPYVGIVRSVEECLHAPTEPALFQVACEVSGGEGLVGSPLEHLSGVGGAGRTRAEAAAAAVGEALERYSASYVPRSRLVVATARELGDSAVVPERFALFSDRQHANGSFPFRRFTPETRVAWVLGHELPSGRPAYLPAELVFLGHVVTDDEQPIAHSTSSGLACGPGREETVVRGLCELLERDAFMVAWKNRLSLPLLQVAPGTPTGELEREFFQPTGLRYAAVDLSVFHRLPSVLGVVRAPAPVSGALGVGAGTAPTIEQAWWKALSEAFSARSAGAKLACIEPRHDLGRHGGRVSTFEDHIRYHAAHERAAAARFLDASERRTPVDSVAALEGRTRRDRIAALCKRIEAAGSSSYRIDVTSPDVAALGLFVTRVIAPELCALDVSHAARFLGGRRLYTAASALGLRADILREADVNPEPHPFP
jgi:ribosomal protein S12 methylthiotransferase accessory factor